MEHRKVEEITSDYVKGWLDAHHAPVPQIQFIEYTENDGLPDGGVRMTGPVLVPPVFALDPAMDLPGFLNERFNEALRRVFDDADEYPVIGVLLAAVALTPEGVVSVNA